jgi:hypothetical protein
MPRPIRRPRPFGRWTATRSAPLPTHRRQAEAVSTGLLLAGMLASHDAAQPGAQWAALVGATARLAAAVLRAFSSGPTLPLALRLGTPRALPLAR